MTPYVKSIYADNGEDYVHLSQYEGEIGKTIFEYFDPIEEGDEYVLVFKAKIELLETYSEEFEEALDFSDNMVQVQLGFLDSDGDSFDDFAEEVNGKETELIE